RFTPHELKVFDKLPPDAINATVHETLRTPAYLDLPASSTEARAWWRATAPQLLEKLKTHVFRGWPSRPPPLNAKEVTPVVAGGLSVRAFDFISQEDVPLRMWLVTGSQNARPKLAVLTAVDEAGWQEFLGELGPDFQSIV